MGTTRVGSMTEGAPWKYILKFAMPVLAGSFLQQLYSTVDAIVVGNFSGEAALSAVGTTNSFTFLFLALAMGFSSGNGVLVAQFYGAGDKENVRKSASSGILFLFLIGIGATIVSILVSRPAFTYLINVQESYLDMTLQYFRIYALGLIFQYGYNIFSAILRAVGDSAAMMYFLLIASVANIGLDLLFVAGFHWGVVGAAVATDISQAASFVAAYFYMVKKYPVFRFKLGDYKWHTDCISKTTQIGFPIALQLVIVSVGLTFIQRAVNSFGQAMTASFTVGQRIEMYLNLPCSAFQTTMATYTGQNIGAGKVDRVKKGVAQGYIVSMTLTFIVSLLVWIFAGNILDAFALSDQAAVYCLQHLRAIAIVNIILATYMPLFGVFQGANHSAVPTCVATVALTLRVLTTYLFCNSSFFGYTIIWWNGLFGFGAGAIIAWSYFLSGKWKKNSRVLEK